MTSNHQLRIRTPEGIVFSQVLAGPTTRFLAWLVDMLCILTLLSVFQEILTIFALLNRNLATAVLLLGYFIISIGYFISFEWLWRGQSPGKRMLRLRVVDAEGLRLQFHQVVTRNLLRFVDALPIFYLVGGLVCWFSGKCQRLGDLAANTIVIRQPRLTEPDLQQLLAGKFNSLRLHPHLAARLRQQVSPAEAAIALQAVLRRDEFAAGARVELFADLARHFAAKAAFPPEAADGITDEQYVRNIVDLVYRPRVDLPSGAARAAEPSRTLSARD
jgi:uncharacterized RDD family membrane protein YckC